MKRVNFEFKARLTDEARVRGVLRRLRAHRVGLDHQVDTYFRARRGRLKVREGNIENALIYYRRADAPRARRAGIEMMLLPRRNCVRAILARALQPLVVVDKRREIYFAGDVKIHLDQVKGLGEFVEVEALSRSGKLTKARQQAMKFQKLFGIASADLVPKSYSDLILQKPSR